MEDADGTRPETRCAAAGDAGGGASGLVDRLVELFAELFAELGCGDAFRVRQILHGDADFGEDLLEIVPAFRAFPVVADEDHVEMVFVPKLHLVARLVDHRHVDFPDRADDLPAVMFADDGLPVLVSLDDRIRMHADDEVVAERFRVPDHVQMSDVEHVVDAVGEPDLVFCHIGKPFCCGGCLIAKKPGSCLQFAVKLLRIVQQIPEVAVLEQDAQGAEDRRAGQDLKAQQEDAGKGDPVHEDDDQAHDRRGEQVFHDVDDLAPDPVPDQRLVRVCVDGECDRVGEESHGRQDHRGFREQDKCDQDDEIDRFLDDVELEDHVAPSDRADRKQVSALDDGKDAGQRISSTGSGSGSAQQDQDRRIRSGVSFATDQDQYHKKTDHISGR